jgi:hypothetical protein
MKCQLCFFISLIIFTSSSIGQDIIDVTDQTMKIGGLKEEILYFGFTSGDKIIFNFNEIDNKEIKEVEILEYPSNTKFSDFKTYKVENKTITISKEGVFAFRFKNSALSGRICKIKIQRIPASEEKRNFNTNISWETIQDTTYHTYSKNIIVGNDTTYIQKTKKVLVKTEQKEELLFDKPQRVNSKTNINGNKTSLFFTLPQNIIAPYKTSQVISWAYWIGVGEEANLVWKQNSQIISNIAKGASTYFTSPLGAFAIGTITDLMIPKSSEIIYYAISDQFNKELFLSGSTNNVYDQGKGPGGYKKFSDKRFCQGTYYILLQNENIMLGLDVSVKVIAIVETNYFEDKNYTETKITDRYEKKIFSDPIIKSRKIPVLEK